MSVRRILAKTIDTDLEYEAIGIDLAKNCVSAALLTTDGEVVCIDRLDYSELEKSAQALSSTTFAMEPCTEMNYLVQKLEAWGHRCLVIGGKNLQDYVENHFSGVPAEKHSFLAGQRRRLLLSGILLVGNGRAD